jgi:hypothetical protein
MHQALKTASLLALQSDAADTRRLLAAIAAVHPSHAKAGDGSCL